MSEVTSVRCYLAPDSSSHPAGFQLREKWSGRRIVLGKLTTAGFPHFLEFIGTAASPAMFSRRRGAHAIVVRGQVDDAGEELRFLHEQQLSYPG